MPWRVWRVARSFLKMERYDIVNFLYKGSLPKKKTTEIVKLVLPLLTPPPPPVIGEKNVGIVVFKFGPPTPSRGREKFNI